MGEQQNPEQYMLPEDQEVTLPSGLVVTLRPPGLPFYVKAGMLPSGLSAIVLQAREGNTEVSPEKLFQDALRDPQTTAAMIEWSYEVIAAVVVKPKFSMDPVPGQFHPSRLRSADATFISNWANQYMKDGGGLDLAPFRSQQAGAMPDAGSNGGAVGQGAIGLSEPEAK